MSLADFIVIAAEAVMSRTSKSYNATDEYAQGTLAQVFRDQFRSGRATAETCDWNMDLMPDPEQGCTDLNNVFQKHIFKFSKGKQRKEFTAAVMGAHTLGTAKIHNSGYQGSWSSKESVGVFDNDYYRSLITKGWGPQLAVGGEEGRNQWQRVDKGRDPDHVEMMLNSDLCLAYDNN